MLKRFVRSAKRYGYKEDFIFLYMARMSLRLKSVNTILH